VWYDPVLKFGCTRGCVLPVPGPPQPPDQQAEASASDLSAGMASVSVSGSVGGAGSNLPVGGGGDDRNINARWSLIAGDNEDIHGKVVHGYVVYCCVWW
jgi:hypothetical protein